MVLASGQVSFINAQQLSGHFATLCPRLSPEVSCLSHNALQQHSLPLLLPYRLISFCFKFQLLSSAYLEDAISPTSFGFPLATVHIHVDVVHWNCTHLAKDKLDKCNRCRCTVATLIGAHSTSVNSTLSINSLKLINNRIILILN